jgi:hypothetical protein
MYDASGFTADACDPVCAWHSLPPHVNTRTAVKMHRHTFFVLVVSFLQAATALVGQGARLGVRPQSRASRELMCPRMAVMDSPPVQTNPVDLPRSTISSSRRVPEAVVSRAPVQVRAYSCLAHAGRHGMLGIDIIYNVMIVLYAWSKWFVALWA